jgi:predicted TIM-barrel fold metal-dependent hydrolase
MNHCIIDPHIHFFNLIQGQYTWLQGDTPPQWPNLNKIKQPISAQQLIKSTEFELAGIVHIEAGFDNENPINELNWLSQHLSDIEYKAISYAAIDQPPLAFKHAISALSHISLCGIRDITQGSDANRLLDKNCFANLVHLSELNLHFEAQFEIENITITKHIASYAKYLPLLNIVINHVGLPNDLIQWQNAIKHLSQYRNIFIKYSGFELLNLTHQHQVQCFKSILKYFGDQRVMFASNYPVCQINTDYNTLWQAYFDLCDNQKRWKKLSYLNAKYIYRL